MRRTLRRCSNSYGSYPHRRDNRSHGSCALAAIAAAKGQPAIAEAVLELLSAEVAEEYLEWTFSR
jgi:hypothetical protein